MSELAVKIRAFEKALDAVLENAIKDEHIPISWVSNTLLIRYHGMVYAMHCQTDAEQKKKELKDMETI